MSMPYLAGNVEFWPKQFLGASAPLELAQWLTELPPKWKNYETYNNERKEQVFASSSKFKKKKNQIASNI